MARSTMLLRFRPTDAPNSIPVSVKRQIGKPNPVPLANIPLPPATMESNSSSSSSSPDAKADHQQPSRTASLVIRPSPSACRVTKKSSSIPKRVKSQTPATTLPRFARPTDASLSKKRRTRGNACLTTPKPKEGILKRHRSFLHSASKKHVSFNEVIDAQSAPATPHTTPQTRPRVPPQTTPRGAFKQATIRIVESSPPSTTNNSSSSSTHSTTATVDDLSSSRRPLSFIEPIVELVRSIFVVINQTRENAESSPVVRRMDEVVYLSRWLGGMKKEVGRFVEGCVREGVYGCEKRLAMRLFAVEKLVGMVVGEMVSVGRSVAGEKELSDEARRILFPPEDALESLEPGLVGKRERAEDESEERRGSGGKRNRV
ncbi:hypothetical protein BJ508DRAFT_307501 [Ascobolus immersus RN42]|uniref:Uncharacterized protein n=1 Tax=Ascobolus immersus RN42 TaxID=1160509 RepID=A0A3N4I2S6_ASCIM|nr:hypothetical protein BJ508DRAFT_307501 [Ascobolus immersus RN42]